MRFRVTLFEDSLTTPSVGQKKSLWCEVNKGCPPRLYISLDDGCRDVMESGSEIPGLVGKPKNWRHQVGY